jgi:uncharacterized protein
MSMSGHFTWFDLMTTDTAEAERFYGDALGYGTQKWDGPMPYTIWSAGGIPFGGLMDLPEKARAMGAPSHWLGYVAVPDVDAAAAKATSLGATVLVPPTTITPTAKFTVLTDPQGAVIAMYSSTDGGAKPVANVCWHELMTEDMDGAIAFYGAMFGWTKGASMDMGPAGTYQLLHIGDTPMVGVMRRPPEMPMPAWGYYHGVPSVGPAIEAGKAAGAKLLHGPIEVPGGEFVATLLDPTGAVYAVVGKS